MGMGIKEIRRRFEVWGKRVGRYVGVFEECGIGIKELGGMGWGGMEEMLCEGVGGKREG